MMHREFTRYAVLFLAMFFVISVSICCGSGKKSAADKSKKTDPVKAGADAGASEDPEVILEDPLVQELFSKAKGLRLLTNMSKEDFEREDYRRLILNSDKEVMRIVELMTPEMVAKLKKIPSELVDNGDVKNFLANLTDERIAAIQGLAQGSQPTTGGGSTGGTGGGAGSPGTGTGGGSLPGGNPSSAEALALLAQTDLCMSGIPTLYDPQNPTASVNELKKRVKSNKSTLGWKSGAGALTPFFRQQGLVINSNRVAYVLYQSNVWFWDYFDTQDHVHFQLVVVDAKCNRIKAGPVVGYDFNPREVLSTFRRGQRQHQDWIFHWWAVPTKSPGMEAAYSSGNRIHPFASAFQGATRIDMQVVLVDKDGHALGPYSNNDLSLDIAE